MGEKRLRAIRARLALAAGAAALVWQAAWAEPQHGIAMYGEPALTADFTALPYANPDAPKGGRIVQGEVGSFDSLNPHILKGRVPWQLSFLAHETLMGRSWDEPFTLYGVLAETVETAPDRAWVEYTLRPEARFSDGTPVTVKDVLWSYETLGTVGHPRYHGTWSRVAKAEAVGERGVRFTFTEPDGELAMLMGMRPILKKAQWDGRDFARSGLSDIPISSAPYVIDDYKAGRYVSLKRNPEYWGDGVVPFMNGQANLDEIRMEFFGDGSVMFEAFKSGVLTTMRETNPQKWATQYDFPAVADGRVVKEEIPHERPSGMTGLLMNTRRAPFDDWRVREAMIQAFNFEFINEVLNGGESPRIKSYFSNSMLGMSHGAAEGRVGEVLAGYEGDLLPGAVEGYALPEGDGTERNRGGTREALALLEEAGWSVAEDGVMRDAEGTALGFEVLLDQGANEPAQVVDLFASALRRLGIEPKVASVDSAQMKERTQVFDFDMIWYQYGLSLSPGNEQLSYFGSEAADQEGSRNMMGATQPAIEGLVGTMLSAESREDFVAAVKALDRVLTSGRYVIPVWHNPVSYLAHDAALRHPERLPIYGDWIGFQPDVWWYEE